MTKPGHMARVPEERRDLAGVIAGELGDSIGIQTAEDRDLTARCIIVRIEYELYQLGWMPPAKTERIFGRILDWCEATRNLPEHHINRSVLNSQMTELVQIVHDEA